MNRPEPIPPGAALNIIHAVKRDAANWAEISPVKCRRAFQAIVDRLEMVAPGYNPNLSGVPINVMLIDASEPADDPNRN